MQKQYTHDCDRCRYLGTGNCKLLGNDVYDFYICGAGDRRSLIARYGNEGPDYQSGILFACVELTRLDKVALFNKLELNEQEKERLLACFARMWKYKLELEDYKDMNVPEVSFGNANVVFSEWSHA